jgi:predicted HTH transcriptional regulator
MFTRAHRSMVGGTHAVDMRAYFGKERYDAVVSVPQAVILLTMAERDSVTTAEAKRTSGLDDAEFERALRPLVKLGFLVENGPEVRQS